MEFLKDVLGDELYAQVAAKVGESDIKPSKITNLSDGGYIDEEKFLRAERTANDAQDLLKERDKQLATLQKSTGDADALKEQIADLQAANETAVAEYAEKLSKTKLAAAKKLAIANARPVDETAARAIEKLIDDEQIKAGEDGYTGITEQTNAMKENPAFISLFETSQKKKPDGFNPPPPPDNTEDDELTDQQLFDKRMKKD